MVKTATVDEYIRSFPEDVRDVLEEVRGSIHRAVPGAGEKISYQMPTITLDGKYMMYFAAWKDHISIYPLPELDEHSNNRSRRTSPARAR